MASKVSVWTQVVINRTHTGGLSAFAAAAAQVCREPSSPPALRSQPCYTRVAQLQNSQCALKAESAPIPRLHQGPGRAATLPCIPPAAASISPWAAMDATTDASALACAAPLTVAKAACQAELVALPHPSKEEHRAQLVQLLEDACRQAQAHQTCSKATHHCKGTEICGRWAVHARRCPERRGSPDMACDACRHQSIDWKVLRCSLQTTRSADAPDVDVSLPPQYLVRDTPANSFLQMVSGGRHDSASSSIETRRPAVPASPRTPKLPVLGRMGTAGSLPVYSYHKPAAEPSCPVRPDPGEE